MGKIKSIMIYNIVFLKSAVKDLEAVEHHYQLIIKKKIIQLSKDYESLENNIKSLKGKHDYYRLRVGRFRIVFMKDDKMILITIVRIGHRRNIYKKL